MHFVLSKIRNLMLLTKIIGIVISFAIHLFFFSYRTTTHFFVNHENNENKVSFISLSYKGLQHNETLQ